MEPRIRASIVVVNEGHLLCVRLADPLTGVVATYIPGGKVEPGETPAIAAERECLEESGYVAIADEESVVVAQYPFVFGGIQYDCTTHFFRGKLANPTKSPQPVSDASYHHGVLWIPLAAIENHFGFHRTIFDVVNALAAI